jgi:predicted Zn-dependent peptidase
MMEVLQTFATHKVSQVDLDNVKNFMLDEWNRSTESVQDIMNELGRGVSIGNWKDFQARQDTLKTITTADIQNTASNIFKPHNMTVTHVIPTKTALQHYPPVEMPSKTSNMSPVVSELTNTHKTSSWSVHKLTPMTHLIHTPKASYVRAVLSARFSPAEHDMASLLVAVMGNSGEHTKNITSELLSLHSERNITHDHEFIHMYMAMPISNHSLKKASGIMFNKEWLNTFFDDQNVELQKRHMISELQSRHTDQSYQVKKEFITSLFKKTQYNIPIQQRIERIKSIRLSDLKTFHKKFVANENSTYLTMTTPSVESASILGDVLPSHTSPPKTTLQWEAAPRKQTHIRKKLEGYGSAAIMMGQTIPKNISEIEKIALKAAASILGGGMTGRLMHIVREQRGLGTYGIYATIQNVSQNSNDIFCIQGTFSPGSLEEGMQCTRSIVKEWQKTGVTPKELSDAKERIIGSRTIAIDEVDELSSLNLKYILEGKDPVREMEKFKQNVESLTLEQINQVLHKYIDIDTLTEVIVGPV